MLLAAIILIVKGMFLLSGGVSLVKVVKGSDLLRRHQCFGGSIQPIPERDFHDPGSAGDPGIGRRVARRVVDSSPGDRLDRAGIG